MNPKEFIQRWKKGMMELSEEQRLKATRNGHLWAVIGGLIGFAFMLYKQMWFFTVFILAIIYLQWIQYRVVRQQLKGFKELQDEIVGEEILREL